MKTCLETTSMFGSREKLIRLKGIQQNAKIYTKITNNLDNDQHSTDKFKIYRWQYILDKNDTGNPHASLTSTNSLPHSCNLYLQKLK